MALTSGEYLRATGDAACESRSAAELKADLNLEVGTDLQVYDAGLLSIAGLTTAANKMIYTSALDVYAVIDLTAFARTILDDADQAAVRTTLGLTPGTNVQAYDAFLLSIAALGTAANKLIYTTGVDTAAEASLTAFARTILDDADAATVLATLGLSTNLADLTDAEAEQLENIAATTISAAQWAYLGAMDQALAAADSVGFAQVTCPLLLMTGTTGAQEIRLTTNLADALSIEDTAGDLIVFDTTTGTQVITVTPPFNVTGLITSSGGITLSGAVDLTFSGTTGQSEIVVQTNLADALSLKDSAGDLILFDTTTGTQVMTVTPALVVTGAITSNGGITLADTKNIAVNTATGSQIATAVGQKLGFWAATPIVQPASANQADQGAMTGVAVGDLVATQNTGWGASTEANFDKIHTAIDQLVADVTALDTLLTAIRTALVNAGIMKGAA